MLRAIFDNSSVKRSMYACVIKALASLFVSIVILFVVRKGFAAASSSR